MKPEVAYLDPWHVIYFLEVKVHFETPTNQLMLANLTRF